MDGKNETRTKEKGFTIIEVIIALGVFAIVFLALMSTLSTSAKLDAITRERSLVANGLRRAIETMRAYDFGDLYENFKPGGLYGDEFAIEGISTSPDDYVAQIVFFVDETDTSTDAIQLGLPRDLDGDGSATNTDVATGGDYILLPVKLSASWEGMTGPSTMDFYVLLADK